MRKLLKYTIVLVTLLLVFEHVSAQSMKINFTTTKITNGKYSPKHVMAVWIKKSGGQYVRTLMIYGSARKSYLYKWKSSSGGDQVDAITGSTTSSLIAYTIQWDMKNFAKQIVGDGDYLLCMEMTSSNGQGPYREIAFTLNGTDFTTNPADQSNFTKMELVYDNGVAASNQMDVEQELVKTYPTLVDTKFKAEVNLLVAGSATFTIYDSNERKIGSKSMHLEQGLSTVDLSEILEESQAGIYFLVTTTGEYVVSNKFIKR